MTGVAELFETALAHHRAGRLDDAIAAYGAALGAQPDHPELLAHLGVAVRDRHGLDAAIGFLQRALVIAPATAAAWNVLANTLRERGLMDDAIDGYRRAVALLPGFAEAHSNLGNTLLGLNRLDDAAAAYRAALALRPELAEPRVGLFSIALTLCDFATADQCYRHVVDLANDPQQEQRGWRILGTLAYRHLFRRLPEPAYQAMSSRIDRFLAAQAAGALPALPPAGRTRPQRLKIGFISTSFGNHAVGQVAVDLFGALDHGRFELHAMSRWDRSAEPQDYHRRMRSAFDGFHEVGIQAPLEIARRIRALGIDILVDLHGYMDHASPEILACRAAPIQVFWLGHAGGLAVGACDYLIADAQTVPAGEEGRYRQRIARLPEIYHCASPHAIAAPPSRAACGLPERGFVFCAFNNPEKIDRAAFAAWLRILGAVEGSVLWLSDPGDLASRRDHLRRAAAAAGIDPARLVFAGWSPDKETHLARHAHAGLLLDTFTLNASTTALDALWAGCPVLTLRGHDFASRIAGTMLQAIGLEDLIAEDLAAYHEQAVRLAQDPAALGGIATRLRANRATHPLFDVARFARHFAQALDTMWEIHMRGEGPSHFDVAKLDGAKLEA